MSVDVTIKDNSSDAADALREGMLRGLAEAGFKVQALAMENIRENQQIDTGAMMNAVYVETPDDNQRDEMVAAALALNESARTAIPGPPVGPEEVRIAEAMEYGVYQEHGWLGETVVDGVRYGQTGMFGRPYLSPAGEQVRKEVPEIVAKHVKRAKDRRKGGTGETPA